MFGGEVVKFTLEICGGSSKLNRRDWETTIDSQRDAQQDHGR